MPSLPIEKKDHTGEEAAQVTRVSMDGTATVQSGACSRGGHIRGDHRARDHALGCKEQDLPCGIVDADTAQLSVTFGSASKPSDCIVETLAAGWQGLSATEHGEIDRVQSNMANGSESRGVRTPLLQRMVQCVDTIGKPIQRLYSPPSHSTYNPLERCWGMMALHGPGAQLIDAETMLEWAKRMTWKGVHPVVALSRTGYDTGVSLSQAAMRAVEARLERNPLLPKWDMLIHPASTD